MCALRYTVDFYLPKNSWLEKVSTWFVRIMQKWQPTLEIGIATIVLVNYNSFEIEWLLLWYWVLCVPYDALLTSVCQKLLTRKSTHLICTYHAKMTTNLDGIAIATIVLVNYNSFEVEWLCCFDNESIVGVTLFSPSCQWLSNISHLIRKKSSRKEPTIIGHNLRDIHIECSKQFKWNLYFYVSGIEFLC